jgi:protein-S-isoprenylcysteine O-methyltransferase Ste14
VRSMAQDPGEAHGGDRGGQPASDLDSPAVPFLDRRTHPRLPAESAFVRVVATAGIVGIGVVLAAILGTQSIQAWVIGLVVSVASVVLAAILWSSRTL